MRLPLLALAVVAGGIGAASAAAQQVPINDGPNPYKTVEGWAKMPEGRTWGSLSAVDIDKDGVSIWVAERCGANDCVGSPLDPVLKFDKDGKLVKSFGAGLIRSPHGIHVDRDGNVWIVDCACTGAGGGGGGRGGRGGRGAAGGDSAGRAAAPPPPPPAPLTAGHQVYKFSPDGTLLLTLGTAGGAREPGYFTQPNDVLTTPNGDIYVVEGHGSTQKSATNPGSPARVLKFDKTGKLLGTFGTVVDSTTKSEPYSFNQPHALAMDSRGRIYVGDRGYNRVKIFDQNMKLLDTWYQLSRPSGLFIDKDDNVYVADSESQSVDRTRTDWKRGIRIGDKNGKFLAFIPDPAENPPSTSAAEGVAVDKNGVIYGAEVGPKALKRYVKP
jgi:sugar lactone lactonase YvrE